MKSVALANQSAGRRHALASVGDYFTLTKPRISLMVLLTVIAAGFLSEAARHMPRTPLAWLCLGDAFKGLRLYEQAGFYYDRAAELEPQNELVFERRKTCQPLLAGLMRIFRGEDVRNRLRDEYRRLVDAARHDDEWA